MNWHGRKQWSRQISCHAEHASAAESAGCHPAHLPHLQRSDHQLSHSGDDRGKGGATEQEQARVTLIMSRARSGHPAS